jgi:hypothetical protein
MSYYGKKNCSCLKTKYSVEYLVTRRKQFVSSLDYHLTKKFNDLYNLRNIKILKSWETTMSLGVLIRLGTQGKCTEFCWGNDQLSYLE